MGAWFRASPAGPVSHHGAPEGQQAGVIMGAANRDETEFPDPDRFDIRRAPNRHLAFGYGRHKCPGKTLARFEARIALQCIIARFPDMALLDEAPGWHTNSCFCGLTALNVRPADTT
ncbi:cytochrome P450 [Thioalkalivibrio thiocyanodenitrificans]|uniref:cytochrome P450 n=1 Tax=Thioalkalivibrio thiocyanodenitrificans TaxID=243063 RepID=UPI0009FE0678|nr:cytochrome P450 [Thioalkalivibrio thiocyanodenitrificans]